MPAINTINRICKDRQLRTPRAYRPDPRIYGLGHPPRSGCGPALADDVTRHDDIITFTVQLSTQAGQVAWAARVFLLLGDGGYIREDCQLTVQPLVA